VQSVLKRSDPSTKTRNLKKGGKKVGNPESKMMAKIRNLPRRSTLFKGLKERQHAKGGHEAGERRIDVRRLI